MTNCQWGDDLRCVHCGYVARKPKTRRNCPMFGPPILDAPPILVVARYSLAVMRWVTAGMPVRTDEQVDDILSICRDCEHYDAAGACAKCGCRVNRSASGLANKLRMATESCPAKKW